jgi:exopolyphosphatase/pppGpp-phosphohydrolase
MEPSVGVVDVGSNTVRLVVWRAGQPIRSSGRCCGSARTWAHGEIPLRKLALTADVVGRYADLARAEGVERLQVLIRGASGREPGPASTAPAATGYPVRVLTAAEGAASHSQAPPDAASPSPRRVSSRSSTSAVARPNS